MDIRKKEDKRKMEEYQKHPMTNFADSINRSMIGEPGEVYPAFPRPSSTGSGSM
jgi:hypothetical protein